MKSQNTQISNQHTPKFVPYHPEKQQQKPKLAPPIPYEQGIELHESLKGILPKSFVILILGKPGSGKTSLLSQLLTRPQFFGKKFDRVLYVTPSNIPDIQHDQKINTSRTLDVKWIESKIKQNSQPWCKNLLLVLDDVVSQIPSNQRNTLKSLFYDRRHLLPAGCVSIIVTTQKYNCAPMWIRVCLNAFFSFNVQPNEIKSLASELNTGKQRRQLQLIYRTLQKHEFLLFNLEQGKAFDSLFNQV